MNLVPYQHSLIGKPQREVMCFRCNTWSPEITTYVDLDGIPFKSYYCNACVGQLMNYGVIVSK